MLNKYNLRLKDKELEEAYCDSERNNILNSTKTVMLVIFGISGIVGLDKLIQIIATGSGIENLIAIILQLFLFAIQYLLQFRFRCLRFHNGNCFVLITYLVMNEVNMFANPQHFLFQYYISFLFIFKVFVVSKSSATLSC